MSIHDGHRSRLRSRFIKYGLDAFNDINALELLLFFSIPRKDTNPVAHALIDRFKTLRGVMDASWAELTEVPGVSEVSAALIKLVPALSKLAYRGETKPGAILKNSSKAADYLIPMFMYEDREIVYLLCLDANNRVRSCVQIAAGVVNSVDLNIRLIAETAMKNRASSVILAHNHPDGDTCPSAQDIETTKRVRESLMLIDIPLVDHLIISGDNYSSLCDMGYL